MTFLTFLLNFEKGLDNFPNQKAEDSVSELKNLMISVSGVRGIVGEGLRPDVITKFAQAYGSEFPGKIVVGRDSRATGLMVKHAVWAGLMSVGCDIIDIDMASTPTTELIVEHPEH